MNLDPLIELDKKIIQGQRGFIDSILVKQNNQPIFKKRYLYDYQRLAPDRSDRVPGLFDYTDPVYHPFYQGGSLHTLQSITKSVTSALVGIAIQRGAVEGVEVAVLPFFENYRVGEDSRRKNWKLEHLLTMTAGIGWDEDSLPYTNLANPCAQMEASQDWIQFVLDQNLSDEPGAVFAYNSGVSQLLAQVIYQSTGLHADEFAARYLFAPLGIREYYWKHTPSGHPDTEGGLYLTTEDLARIGQLYLQDGYWDGKRILPADWVEASWEPRVDASADGADFSYGYQWWVIGHEKTPAYIAWGYGGQYLLVMPSHNLVAVFTAWNISGQATFGIQDAYQVLIRLAEA